MGEQPTKRQQQATQTEERLRRAGIRLFQQRGYENTKISDICKEAGVSVGNFYHYFPSKDHLILMEYSVFDTYTEQVLSKRSYPSTLEAIRDLLRSQVLASNCTDVPSSATQILQAQLNTHGGYVIEETRYFHTYMKQLLRQGIENGEIHPSHDVDRTAQLLFQVSRGISFDWVMRGGTFDRKESIELALELLLPPLTRPKEISEPLRSDFGEYEQWKNNYYKENGWIEEPPEHLSQEEAEL